MTDQPDALFQIGQKRIIGMVHLPPLPGTPFYRQEPMAAFCATAVADARALEAGGASGCLIQTVDRVYAAECDPARLAALTLIAAAVVEATRPDFIVGIQIMKNALEASIAVAKVVGADFVRATAFIGATNSQFGVLRGDPYRLLSYRKQIGAESVAIVADIRTQHFSWAEGTPPLGRIAKWAKEAGADAVCVGDPDDAVTLALLGEIRSRVPDLPVVISGHTTPTNAAQLLPAAEGAFVGTCLQRSGWSGRIDESLVRAYMASVRGALL